ncbi:hypothetical protein DFA_03199 [Cavenderia fasciculata]|uniref:Clu domain-containing protein n=1 Tax=Cavenderia fasciculata TaxID=261658 RepID=F4PGX0_CACFS|nr:uncharacterized protein DFA_03199 [Cavenderia fasciculata]EGG24954.1 hypothetical protein DFA_03199 [Cavenderia fasciculata]|eukprot:XP_004362805.1 hypothetical protein DFA_03199 [Cavenderia fasciculata]
MVDHRPNENIWYYLKREAYKEAGDARELTSPLSIFADEIEASSYLGGDSQFSSNQYTSVYGDIKPSGIYGANSSLYTTNLTSIDSDIGGGGGSSYVKDSFWKDDSAVSSYSIPSSAGYLADTSGLSDSASVSVSSPTPSDDLNSIVSYINTYSDYSQSHHRRHQSTSAATNTKEKTTTTTNGNIYTHNRNISLGSPPAANYSSYIEAFSEHGGGGGDRNLVGSTNSGSSMISASTGSNSSTTSGLGNSAGSGYSGHPSSGVANYLNHPPPPTSLTNSMTTTTTTKIPLAQTPEMALSGDSVKSTNSSTNINLLIKEGIEENKNISSLPWNESFQELLDRPVNSLEEERVRNHSISLFSQHLANTATTYVKTLVQEVHMRSECKSIKPYEGAGGFAGGEKYRVESMFIKFALNPHQIYEKSNPVSYFANKGAGHELKSINALVSCGVPNLHFPLMCLLNYRGFRLIVISELPISSKTLVFGSSNAGETIHKNDTVLKMMVKVGEILNLKEHLVEENRFAIRRTGLQYNIPLAIDIEGHFGFDGRYYVVDTARLFPPETPIPGITGCHLYRLFRPEFVKKYETQLCSDAFANFNVVNQDPYNEEATKANNHLILEYIPAFVERFVAAEVTGKTLKETLHKEGINLRYLGVILYHITCTLEKIDEPRKRYLQGLLCIEMLARVMRFVVFTEMRQINAPDDEPHLTVAINHLNKLLTMGTGDTNSKYWSIFLTKSLIGKYSYTCTTVPKVEKQVGELFTSTKGLSTILNTMTQPVITLSPPFTAAYYTPAKNSIKYKFIKKFAELTGLVFDENTMKQLKEDQNPVTLTIKDIKQIDITVKHMRVSSSFKTFVNYSEAETYYKTELEYKSNKLGKDHTQVALTHIHLAELYETYSNLQGAQRHYNEAITIYQARFGQDDIGTANFKEKLALCLIKQKNYLDASKLLESVLIVKIKIFKDNSIEVADTYDNLAWTLQSQGLYEKSLSYYNKALKIKASKSGNSLSVAKTLNNLGHLLLSNNELEKSLDIFLKVEDIFVKQYGRNHSDVAVTLDNIGLVYAKKKNYSMAEKYFKDCLEIRTKQFGEVSRYVALTLDHMAQMYISWGRSKHSEAQKIFDRCIDISDRFPDHYLKAFLRYNYSKLYKKRKEKNKELEFLGQAQMIFEMNNITTDLLPKIRKRVETLNKSGLSRIKDWFNAPSILKPSVGPEIQVSQHLSTGHMEMLSSNVNTRNEDVPSEWQAILNEAGIAKENWNDPTYMQMIQDFVGQEEFERQRMVSPSSSPFVNPFVAVEEGRKKVQEMGKKLKNKATAAYMEKTSRGSEKSLELSDSKNSNNSNSSTGSGGGSGWGFFKDGKSKEQPKRSSVANPPSPSSSPPVHRKSPVVSGSSCNSKSSSTSMSALSGSTKRMSLSTDPLPPPALPQPIFSPPLTSSLSSSGTSISEDRLANSMDSNSSGPIVYRSFKESIETEENDDEDDSSDDDNDEMYMDQSNIQMTQQQQPKPLPPVPTNAALPLPPTPSPPITTTTAAPTTRVSPTTSSQSLYPRIEYPTQYPLAHQVPPTYPAPVPNYYIHPAPPVPARPPTYNYMGGYHQPPVAYQQQYYPPQYYNSQYIYPQQQPVQQQPQQQYPPVVYQSPPLVQQQQQQQQVQQPVVSPIIAPVSPPYTQFNHHQVPPLQIPQRPLPSLPAHISNGNINNNNNNNNNNNYRNGPALYPPIVTTTQQSPAVPISLYGSNSSTDLLRETRPTRDDPSNMFEIDSDDEDDDDQSSPRQLQQPQHQSYGYPQQPQQQSPPYNPYQQPSYGYQQQQQPQQTTPYLYPHVHPQQTQQQQNMFNWPSVKTPMDKDRLVSMLKTKFQEQQGFKI